MSMMIHGVASIDTRKMRAVRLHRGFSQEALAQMAGTTQTTICRIEGGRRKRVRTLTKKAIEAALGVDLSMPTGRPIAEALM
jgi:transcriptional regulator with XRE-family HTH domain